MDYIVCQRKRDMSIIKRNGPNNLSRQKGHNNCQSKWDISLSRQNGNNHHLAGKIKGHTACQGNMTYIAILTEIEDLLRHYDTCLTYCLSMRNVCVILQFRSIECEYKYWSVQYQRLGQPVNT